MDETPACRWRMLTGSSRMRRPRRARKTAASGSGSSGAAEAGQPVDLVRGELAVAVDLEGDGVALLQGVAEPRLHRPSYSQVEAEVEDGIAHVAGDSGGGVGGAVVDDDDVEPGGRGAQLGQDEAEGALLIVGGNDDQPSGGVAHCCASGA